MANTLNYPGNRTDYDPDQIMGPDLYGAYYRVIGSEYDHKLARTKLHLQPFVLDR